ncbi:hypothetical protein CMMCAS02_05350 [Clavibacter michiganensis subsp. michiganensis]|nr:hypothetical protein CMMCAS02_05350 [Clavibacter michiganensis subsp. michiganensis]OUE15581.1 hypothetical protein CMMCA002_05425 [Clavibacter michiganensis subsp. michiganensis]
MPRARRRRTGRASGSARPCPPRRRVDGDEPAGLRHALLDGHAEPQALSGDAALVEPDAVVDDVDRHALVTVAGDDERPGDGLGRGAGVLEAVHHRLHRRGVDRLGGGHRDRARAEVARLEDERRGERGGGVDDALRDGAQGHRGVVVRALLRRGQVPHRVGGHRGGELPGRRIRGAGRREQRGEHAVVHDRVDLHALHLRGMLAHRVRVARQRGALGPVDPEGRLSEHRDDHQDRAAEDDRVEDLQERVERRDHAVAHRHLEEAEPERHGDRVDHRDPEAEGHRGARGRDRELLVQERLRDGREGLGDDRERPRREREDEDQGDGRVRGHDPAADHAGDARPDEAAEEHHEEGDAPGRAHGVQLPVDDLQRLQGEEQTERAGAAGEDRLDAGEADGVVGGPRRGAGEGARHGGRGARRAGRRPSGHRRRPGPVPGGCRLPRRGGAGRPSWGRGGRPRRTSRGSGRGTRAPCCSRCPAAARRA